MSTINFQFQPLAGWPLERTRDRQRSRFGASYGDTLALLETELVHLCAKNVVIQADCDRSEIRNDGQLRANARLRGPGIILSFDSKYGPLSYPCDKFLNWDCNLRAIALSLEALRKVDRYGVTKRAEQYKGWEKLPPPANAELPLTVGTAAGTLLRAAGWEATSLAKDQLDAVYRAAARRTHPDHGGNAEQFKRVEQARCLLAKHWGVA